MTDDGSVSRRAVLKRLAAASDADSEETTTVDALASALDANDGRVDAHLEELTACDLARKGDDGSVRVTITGEELLELDTEEMVIVDPERSGSKQ